MQADPADQEARRSNSYLAEHLVVPFKVWCSASMSRSVHTHHLLMTVTQAKFNGERCTVLEAIGGDKLLVKQFGDSFACRASAISGAKGHNAAVLAEWANYYT